MGKNGQKKKPPNPATKDALDRPVDETSTNDAIPDRSPNDLCQNGATPAQADGPAGILERPDDQSCGGCYYYGLPLAFRVGVCARKGSGHEEPGSTNWCHLFEPKPAPPGLSESDRADLVDTFGLLLDAAEADDESATEAAMLRIAAMLDQKGAPDGWRAGLRWAFGLGARDAGRANQ